MFLLTLCRHNGFGMKEKRDANLDCQNQASFPFERSSDGVFELPLLSSADGHWHAHCAHRLEWGIGVVTAHNCSLSPNSGNVGRSFHSCCGGAKVARETAACLCSGLSSGHTVQCKFCHAGIVGSLYSSAIRGYARLLGREEDLVNLCHYSRSPRLLCFVPAISK